MRPLVRLLSALTLVWASAVLAAPPSAGAPAAPAPTAAATPAGPGAAQVTAFHASGELFVDDDLTLVEVRAGQDQVTDSMSAYSSRAGVFLPLGELTRALDLAVTVYPPEKRAAGWVLQESRKFSVDLTTHTARIGGQTIAIPADQAAFHADDIYVRMDLMEKLLPINLKFDARALVLRIDAREPLPFQARLARERRGKEIGGHTDQTTVLRINTPYLAYTPPTLDVMLAGGVGLAAPHETGQWEMRAAGDLAWSAMQLFADSDQSGRLDNVRLTLGRKDYSGHLLGPLKGTDIEAGDTFTPNLSLGERSAGGRGVYFSSGPLGGGSVFSHLDLRGELPEGYQVELYVNEVLVGSQTQASQGRYEFLNVPLSFGANTLRLVFYGPHGEQREEVRHYNFGAGQLDKGKLVLKIGAVQEGANLISAPHPSLGAGAAPTVPTAGQGKVRAAMEVEYGLTPALTLAGGFSQYTPATNETRDIVEAGFRTSLGRMAMQFDAGKDLAGGEAFALNLAGRLAGVTFIANDSEYEGLFLDENQRSGVNGGPLARSTALRVDWIQRFFPTGPGIPISLDFQRDQKPGGEVYTTADARFSGTPGGYFVASTLGFSQNAGGATGVANAMSGSLEVSRLFGAGWQMRGGLQYQVLPEPVAQSVFLDLDHTMTSRNSLRLALSQSLSSGYSTTAQVSDTFHFKRADVAVTTSFSSQTHDFRVGLQLSFSLLFDPTHGAYRLARPGASSGGDVAFDAFVDANGDGRREKGEEPLPDLPLESQGPAVKTDHDGRALITGLGDGAVARIRIRTESLDEPYAIPPADVIEVIPRPGRVTVVDYGLKPVGEVQLRMTTLRGAARKGISGLDIQLVGADKRVAAESRTEYDGSMFIEKVPPGRYEVRIEPEQGRRLGMSLARPVSVTVPPKGGFVGNIEGDVVIKP